MRGSKDASQVILTFVGLSIALAMAGCGSHPGVAIAPVSGTISYKGKPVDEANVTFTPEGSSPRSATGRTDAQGNFKLTTFDTNDGAILGENTITVSKPDPKAASQSMDASNPGADYDAAMRAIASGTGGGGAPKKEWMPTTLPAKYAKRDTSPLKRTVAQGDNNFKIELED